MSEKSHVHAGKERQNTDRRKDETTRNEGRDRNAGKERERVCVCVCVCVCVTKERQTDRQDKVKFPVSFNELFHTCKILFPAIV